MVSDRLKLKFDDRSPHNLASVAWITFDGEEITTDCMSMTEIEEHLHRLETSISEIRETARRIFAREK